MPSVKPKNNEVLIKKILETGINFEHRFIPDYDELGRVIDLLKKLGYRISMTQGVWDMLHIGHVRYLSEAKSTGDILIVGVDTDQYTQARKGPTRPIVPESERLEMLAGLRCIDILTVRRHTDHPDRLVQVVKPDILIVSSTTADVGEKEKKSKSKYCGKIVVLEPKATVSTTSRLRKLLTDGASNLADKIKDLIEDYLKKA